MTERPPHIPADRWERMSWHAKSRVSTAAARAERAPYVKPSTSQQQAAARARFHGQEGATLVEQTRPEAVRLHGEGLSEAQIAERLGVPKSRVHRALDGHVTPRPARPVLTGHAVILRSRELRAS